MTACYKTLAQMSHFSEVSTLQVWYVGVTMYNIHHHNISDIAVALLSYNETAPSEREVLMFSVCLVCNHN